MRGSYTDEEMNKLRDEIVRKLRAYDARQPRQASRARTLPVSRPEIKTRPMTQTEMLAVARRAIDEGQRDLAQRLLAAIKHERTGQGGARRREMATLTRGIRDER